MNKYIALPCGSIFSLKSQKILIPRLNKSGYLRVNIIIDGKHRTKSVHRLIAENLIPNPDKKPQVNHIDGNKLNNSVENLEWVTCSENKIHALKLRLHKPDERNMDSFSKKVLDLETGIYYNSISEASKFNVINYQTLFARIARYKIEKRFICV